jgi:hypothetical protein
LDPGEVLTSLAEVAVTLAALSGVAGVLGTVDPDSPSDEMRRILLRDVALLGLVAALFAMLPLLLGAEADAEGLVWRLLSAALGAGWVVLFLRVVPKLARLNQARSKVFWVGPAATLVGLSLFSWNVVVPDSFSPNRYAGGLVCLLVVSGGAFLIAVFGHRHPK